MESAHATERLPAIKVTSARLDELINRQFTDLAQQLSDLGRTTASAVRVDGQIIGTGKADFTTDNTLYTLNYEGKIFQLIDVPGIEGDESKYVNMVHQAVAKGHLVFYVNGTNKKPEKATAEKIRAYLRRGTQVCPIVNIRGNADAYEFEEDRESLEQDNAAKALKQTTDVLKAVLSKDVLLSGVCVQGLLAFASLAMNSQTGQSTIHPSRSKDLVRQQLNYRKHFSSTGAMLEFSQIGVVAKVLRDKLGTFKEDIIESNKVKVLELLTENIAELDKTLKGHQNFIDKVNPEFKKCRESILGATESFERLITAGRRNVWNNFFNTISEEADEIVDSHFGNGDLISIKINSACETHQEKIGTELQKQLDQHLAGMYETVKQAMERLIQDIKRIEFQQSFSLGEESYQQVYHSAPVDMSLGRDDWGKILSDIGSYAATGALIFSPIPGVGPAIGAVIGAIVGILVGLMNLSVGKRKRIRMAQAQVQGKINEAREKVMSDLTGQSRDLVATIRKDVQEKILDRVDGIYASLTRPLAIIEQQISLMTRIKEQLEKMPYGTIQAL